MGCGELVNRPHPGINNAPTQPGLTRDNKANTVVWLVGQSVGWEINIPFQHKNSLYQGLGLAASTKHVRKNV